MRRSRARPHHPHHHVPDAQHQHRARAGRQQGSTSQPVKLAACANVFTQQSMIQQQRQRRAWRQPLAVQPGGGRSAHRR